MADPQLDLQEQVTRINLAIAEATKFAAEQRKLTAEAEKLNAEARLHDRNRWQGWQLVVTAMTAVRGRGCLHQAFGRLI